LNPEAQMELFRIIQEMLSNARKHGWASLVKIAFDGQDQLLRIQIQENGRGFDPAPGAGTRVIVEAQPGAHHV